MKIYAISDIHGYIDEFNTALSYIDLDDKDAKLIILGDYIHGHDSYSVLDRVMELQEKYGSERIITLMGNHELAILEKRALISDFDDVRRDRTDDTKYLTWMRTLKFYYKTDKQIFVHAGIDEDAEELWESGTPEWMFCEKYPHSIGLFYKDIIAGHIGTAAISGNPSFHDIYFDGLSHYYLDGSVNISKVIPILMYDTESGKYYRIFEGKIEEI